MVQASGRTRADQRFRSSTLNVTGGGVLADVCPHCGGLTRSDETQVHLWRVECVENKWPIRHDRVSEQTGAKLLDVSVRYLAERRKRGCGPVVSGLPVAGSRFSYELMALARFKAANDSGDDWG